MIIPERMDVQMPVRVDAQRLWAGGSATAVVAGFTVVTGVLVARGVFHVPVSAVRATSFAGLAVISYAARAAACALLATALLHVLLASVPRPFAFFGWITALAAVAAAATPFTQSAPLASQVGTALINIAVGTAVLRLLPGVARTAIRSASRPCSTGAPPAPRGSA